MFTGLIEDIGNVAAVAVTTAGAEGARRLTIETQLAAEAVPLGASIAIDGTCLTVVEWRPGSVDFVAGAETLENMGDTAGKARKRGQDMKEQGKSYFTQWEKQMAEVKNEEIRNLEHQDCPEQGDSAGDVRRRRGE